MSNKSKPAMHGEMATPRCVERECLFFEGAISITSENNALIPVCIAFPDGIPDEIAYGDNLHLTKFPGDNDIQFKKRESNDPPLGA